MVFIRNPPSHLFEDTGTFQKVTVTTGTGGSHKQTFADDPAITGIACEIQPRSTQMRVDMAGEKELQEFQIFTDPKHNIYAGGRFVFTDKGGVTRTTRVAASKNTLQTSVLRVFDCVEVPG